MDVSIIIVNYNTEKLLKECITSIIDKTENLLYEIIVVDNNSVKSPNKMLSENFPEVIFVQSDENLGFGKANNLGVSYAKGKYVFLLNSDTILINNAIKILFDFKDKNKEIGACGGNLFTEDMKPNFSFSMYYPSLFSIIAYRLHLSFLLNNNVFNESGKPQDVAIVIGADLLMEKELFDELSGFDPAFFMYVEDGELQLRIKKKGLKMMSVPEAKIIHLQGASSSTFFKMKTEFDSYFYYFKKHFNISSQTKYKYIELFSNSIKLIYFTLTNNKSKKKDYQDILKYIYAKR
ncbi:MULTISPECIES: glycosyltransferase family 2 protein [Chryseobacterium]|nr:MULTISPECIES: glycosyltransferase family 2 protein [Chryseobacterium]